MKDSPVIFSTGDVCQELPYESDSFDLVFSINSFEHFYSPEAALDEMLRVLRPDGFLFLAFSPLYYSPWGLHASRRLGFPYPQLLISPATIHQFVEQNKAALANTYSDFADRNKIGPDLNAYSLDQYRQIFKAQRSRLKFLAYVEVVSLEGLHLIHRYPGIIKTKTPSAQSLIVSGIKLLASPWIHLPAWTSLVVIAGVLGGSVIVSLAHTRREEQREAADASPAEVPTE